MRRRERESDWSEIEVERIERMTCKIHLDLSGIIFYKEMKNNFFTWRVDKNTREVILNLTLTSGYAKNREWNYP